MSETQGRDVSRLQSQTWRDVNKSYVLADVTVTSLLGIKERDESHSTYQMDHCHSDKLYDIHHHQYSSLHGSPG